MGQFLLAFENEPIISNSKLLDMAWAGGLNAAQYSTTDINGDGKQDLVLYDRSNANINTFLNRDTFWEYAPLYERYFPDDLEGWMLLRDYDCDGKEDLFTRSPFGIRVFRNTSTGSDGLSFELFKNIVFTEGNSGQINLQVNISDIPAIEDIDNDGDLDILTFDSGLGGNVEYHQNMSLETYGTCDSLEYVRVVDSWGDFQECNCLDFAFGETCEEKNGGRLLHASGKALLALDFDDDGDKDLLYGDEDCNEVMYLENIGDKDNALIRDFTTDFPNSTNPASFSTFPGSFKLDLDFDGQENLVFAPNVFTNYTGDIDFSNSNWIYRNDGTIGNPDYSLIQTNFLQDQMIDLGELAAPALIDLDGDGDLDLLIGHSRIENNTTVHALARFENIGTPSIPAFQQRELDFLGFAALNIRGIRPYYQDMDRDNIPDLLISGTTQAPIQTIFFYKNTSTNNGLSIDIDDRVTLGLNLTTAVNIAFLDADLDGVQDVLAGTTQGNLQYYRGTGINPFTYELVQNDYAGLVSDPSRPSLVPFAIDLNDNGEPELITLDRTGKLRIFEDVRLSPNPAVYETVLKDGDEMATSSFGERTLLLAGDIYQSGFPSLILGTAQGGLHYLDNQSMDGPVVSERLSFIVFPNPAIGESELLKVRANRPGTFDLIDLSGRVIQSDISIPGNSNFEIDIRTLPPGVYVLRGQSNGFGVQSQRVIIAQ